MLRSTNSPPSAGKAISHSFHSFPGMSVPGHFNQGS